MSSSRVPRHLFRDRFARVVVGALVVASGPSTGAVSAACWRPPVVGQVVDPFRPPPCPFCAGNRGLEYETTPGSAVRAVAAGEVTFSGSVAGTRYVVVRLANGWLVTYGRLSATGVRRGAPVIAGSIVGRSGGALFLGLRIDGNYVDPAPYLGSLVGRWRLVPGDGSAASPAPPPRLRCRSERG